MNGDGMTIQELFVEQRRIEEEATLAGIRRANMALAKSREKGREATSAVGVAMVRRIVTPMTEMLRADFEKRGKGAASRGGPLLRPLRDLDPEVLCLAASRTALNRMSKPSKLTALCRRVGEALEDELRWHRWEQLDPVTVGAIRERVNQSAPGRRRHVLAGFARRWEERALREAWKSSQLIGVGLRFVDYLVRLGVLDKCKLDVRTSAKLKLKQAWGVKLSAEAEQWHAEMAEFLTLSRPLAWPLVIPPVPWTASYGGGFHFREGMDHPLIPGPLKPLQLVRRACREQKKLLEAADLSVVFEGLNALQATSWRINPRVYSVLTRLVDEGRDVPGITAYDPQEFPERLSEEEVAQHPQRLVTHKNKLRIIHTENARMISKRRAQHRIFSTARKFVPYKELYFAYNLDFRGRVYACSDDLSPQGNDLQRGLLEFAHGDPLDQDGADWLLIHLANCWGVDKVSYRDRIRWAVDNLPMIRRVAEDPLEHRDWFNADKKFVWQFLAACFAWADYEEHGTGVICRTPVMLDGSCSGIQHYAALMRDEETAPKVNLVPQAAPGDLYSDVALRTMELLAASPAPWAAEWHSWGITRKIVKRPVMVLPYGGSFLSTLKYVREELKERMKDEGRPAWFPDANASKPEQKRAREAEVALAQFVWTAMKEKVTKPMEGMAYVKRLVLAWAKQRGQRNKLAWTSPCGFPVVSNYVRRSDTKGFAKGAIAGSPLVLRFDEPTDVIHWGKVVMGAPPNFVHSLDASHLLFVLRRAKAEGITNLAAVHDAFGTTPTKTSMFARVLREEFSALYRNDPFECLRAAARALAVSVPAGPVLGSLDTEQVRDAGYLFA